ncbi:unnamed protein product [Paramecium pentaurelia]|uniref:Protein kinase domain-containing protein n=1 Tax=Paramecium pentaurelia TaxID=43138 RepID=A0A8S1XMK9_9CILI|nr:unnamed protein product [Paramecium pentaurelia]
MELKKYNEKKLLYIFNAQQNLTLNLNQRRKKQWQQQILKQNVLRQHISNQLIRNQYEFLDRFRLIWDSLYLLRQIKHIITTMRKIENYSKDPKMEREIGLMQLIMQKGNNNNNIVRVYHVEIEKQRIILILERCKCDLQAQFNQKKKKENKYYTPNEVINILKQITNGYKFLYDNNIIHRDIKPQNILYLNGVYKIADFGLARVYQENDDLTKAGTLKYASPQQILGQQKFTNSADIFSLGIVCYELIFGCLPYKISNYQQLLFQLGRLESNPVKIDRSVSGMTEEIAILIENMLKYHENQRISWIDLFAHPLLNDHKFTPIQQIIKPQIIPAKIQTTPQNIVPMIQQISNQSDQFYQIAAFMNNVLDSLDKHLNQQKQIHADMIKIKLQLYYLSSCFYEHSKAMKSKQQAFQKQVYTLANVEIAIKNLDKAKQLLQDQINNYGLSANFPLKETVADYNNYFTQLNSLLTTQFLFPYTNKCNYYLEYLQLLFCLLKLRELKDLSDLSLVFKLIIDTKNQLQQEAVIRKTLDQKMNN